MIPMDTNSDSGPHAVEREVGRLGDRRGVDSVRRDTILPSPSKATATGFLPRRSTRLATSGFRGVKRSRRPLKLPTGRTLRAHVSRVVEGSRTVAGVGSSTPIGTAMSKVDLRSTALTSESDDAVVPRGVVDAVNQRCMGRGHVEEERSVAPSSALLLSAPVAPKDAKRPCFCHHPQQQHHHPHHPHHHHQQQDQQHLSPGCQMPHPSSEGTLVGRVPSSPRLINIPVHDDPRQWSRLDVRTWLDHVRRVYNIRDLDLDRFPMNGKALCIMSKDMFVYRVPHGGVPLYIDFQLRFRRALGIR